NDLAMVSQGMNQFFPDPTGWKDYYPLGNANLARFATSLGATAYEVSSPQAMREAFPQALANAEAHRRPQVIIAHINTDAVPPYYPPKSS
ncbi:MAG: thiamine pyrophosphate-binding protein, partial [Chloroflexota bacterium]